MHRHKQFILTLGFMLTSSYVNATDCSTESGLNTTPLLELYTSEGCSSCPPADQWLSNLKPIDYPLSTLAFHVDYWDYIGWKDSYAKPAFSKRQRSISAFNHSSFIYTPQFVLNGHDFQDWKMQFVSGVRAASTPSSVHLKLIEKTDSHGRISIKAIATPIAENYSDQTYLFLAVYENGLKRKIKAGENNGRELKHDYVVRELLGGYSIPQNKPLTKDFNLNRRWIHKNAGAVLFVQNMKSGEIIQSLTLPLCHFPNFDTSQSMAHDH